MRIISGKYKGFRLDKKLPQGIRPTTDSTKETIFNILTNLIDFDGIYVCDLFAGSGGLGFEALSRGARYCTFVDRSGKANMFIKTFAEHLKLSDEHYSCLKLDVLKYLKPDLSDIKYNLIFLDPPYKANIINNVINLIITMDILTEDGIIVAESAVGKGITLPDELQIINSKIFGSTQVHFIARSR
jgi:16S rRNA (guanine966-N2)-methyltransferase